MRHILTALLITLLASGQLSFSQQNEAKSSQIVKRLDYIANLGDNILKYMTFNTAKGVWAIYPSGGYSSRTGLEFGFMPVYSWNTEDNLQYFKKINTLSTSAQFSTKGMIELHSEIDWYLSPQWQFSGHLKILSINDQYWDRWSKNKFAQSKNYQSNHYGIKVEFLRHLSHDTYIGLSTLIWNYHFNAREKNINFNQLYGSKGGWLAGIGPAILYDTRDHVLYPQSGKYFKASWTLFQKKTLGNYAYNNYLVDLRQFIKIGLPVLAFQGLWEYNDQESPFFVMPQLGGKERLRGIGHAQRTVDNSVWLIRAELRTDIWWRFGGVLFSEVGQASGHPQFIWKNNIYSNGVGLRFRILPDEPLNIRIDAAWSSEKQKGFFISLKEAF